MFYCAINKVNLIDKLQNYILLLQDPSVVQAFFHRPSKVLASSELLQYFKLRIKKHVQKSELAHPVFN